MLKKLLLSLSLLLIFAGSLSTPANAQVAVRIGPRRHHRPYHRYHRRYYRHHR